jgi:sodium-dependent phosphate cotransporter
VLVQSSSVTTSTIVGLVGAGSLPIETAVPMILGANIGTTVTNTLVSLGFLRRTKEFRLAFAGATMHDFFNLCNVAVMLPLELTTGFLSRISTWTADRLNITSTIGGNSPIKSFIKAPVDLAERGLEALGAGGRVLGSVLLVLGLLSILLSLALITRNMRLVMAGRVERSINAILSRGGGLAAIVIGALMTISVQSSSITTSVLIPMIAAGIITLQNAFPITLGANIGTTITALLASLAIDQPAGLVIALVHFYVNVIGVTVFYSIPFLRRLPIDLAQRLARRAEIRKSLVLIYVLGGFVVIPIIGVLILR